MAGLILTVAGIDNGRASDHLDTPSVKADPGADIGDVYAWTSPDGRQLNLVMTIVGHTFSDKLRYTFHIDSGKWFGRTTATTAIVCRFTSMNKIDCQAGQVDRAVGDPGKEQGLQGRNRRFRVFAGLRGDPFFNNVKGSRDAFLTAADALQRGTAVDAAGCPQFSAAKAQEIMDRWRHTSGGPPTDFLAGWTPASIVVSIDLDAVNKGGKLLAVWGETATSRKRIDRAARPLTGNALLGSLAAAEVSDKLKEEYNEASPATSAKFIAEIQKGLGLYDGYDGTCGNQWLADEGADPSARYRVLATLLADDRIWINSASGACTQLFGVELAHVSGRKELLDDCGGRTPNYDAANIFRSLLANGTLSGVDDGLHRKGREPSATVFPFLAAPEPARDYVH
nr:hypothetical protein [Betaproteobacteria bacterium]